MSFLRLTNCRIPTGILRYMFNSLRFYKFEAFLWKKVKKLLVNKKKEANSIAGSRRLGDLNLSAEHVKHALTSKFRKGK